MSEPVESLLFQRRSVRRFKSEQPPRALIERLLSLAVSAPSASNKQPWRWLVVRDRAVIDAMAAAVRAAVARVAASVRADARAGFEAYGDYFTRFEGAPTVIVPVCRAMSVLSHIVDESVGDEDREAIAVMESQSAMASTAMAVENLLLAAGPLGLGASAMTGPLVAGREIAAILRVAAGWSIVAVVPVGYADEAPVATERKSVASVVRWYDNE